MIITCKNLGVFMNLKTKIEIENFLKKQRIIKYKKGQILVRPEDSLGKIILEKEGYARIYKMTSDGKEISWPKLRPMWAYSISSALLERENEYYAEAITNLEAWVIPVKDFMEFLEKNTVIHSEIYKGIISELLELSEQIEKIMFAEAYAKIAILIKDLADKFGKKDKNKIIIELNIPHRILASITGLTRETVTLQVLKMQKENIVEGKSRNFIIKDMEKLISIAQI